MLDPTGAAPNSRRNPRANSERPVSAFTRGNRASWGEVDERPAMLATLDPRFAGLGLSDRVPVFAMRRPMRDASDGRKRGTRAPVAAPTVIIGGRFKVRAVNAAPRAARPVAGPCACCHLTRCEAGAW